MRIEVLDDPASAVADLLVEAAAAGGHIVLTGGSSPKRAYQLAARGDWGGATVWYSDERCVPEDHEWSNHAMAEAALLSHLDPRPEVMRMEGELGHERGAEHLRGAGARAARRRAALGPAAARPRARLALASLFPGKPEVDVTDRLVVGVPEAGMDPQVPRISLTLPAINAARHVVFLVTGESKREAVRRVFGDDPDPTSPAAHVRPADGELTVYLDPAAAP